MPETVLEPPVKNERPTPAFFSIIVVVGSILLTVVVAAVIFILQFSGSLLQQLNLL